MKINFRESVKDFLIGALVVQLLLGLFGGYFLVFFIGSLITAGLIGLWYILKYGW